MPSVALLPAAPAASAGDTIRHHVDHFMAAEDARGRHTWHTGLGLPRAHLMSSQASAGCSAVLHGGSSHGAMPDCGTVAWLSAFSWRR